MMYEDLETADPAAAPPAEDGTWFEEEELEPLATAPLHSTGYEPVVELILGDRGMGKSWYARDRISDLLIAGAEYAFIHDPNGIFPEEGMSLYDADDNGAWSVLSDPNEWQGERVAAFRGCDPSAVADLTMSVGNSIYVADEVDLLCGPNRWTSESARKIVHYGRHNGNSIIGTARRFANVHSDLLALYTSIRLFRLRGYHDVGRMMDEWGPRVAAMVAGLPDPKTAGRGVYLRIPEDLTETDRPRWQIAQGVARPTIIRQVEDPRLLTPALMPRNETGS